MFDIKVTKEELDLILSRRESLEIDIAKASKFNIQTLETMIGHSVYNNPIFIIPGSDPNLPNVGFFTSSSGFELGYTERISIEAIRECYFKLKGHYYGKSRMV